MIEEAIASYYAKRQDFPFIVRFLDAADRSEIEKLIVHGPGPVRIPPLSQGGERVVLVETTYPNGHQYTTGPDVDEFRLVKPPPV